MTPRPKREIIVEYEQIKLIRKRVSTEFAVCSKCGRESDFVRLADAAELFDANQEDVFEFANRSGHHPTTNDGGIAVCLISLLDGIKAKILNQQIKLLRD